MSKEVIQRQFSRLQVYKLPENGTLLGHGSVVVGGVTEVCFVIRENKADQEIYVKWPSHRSKNKKQYSDVRFLDIGVRDELENQILDAFEVAEARPPRKQEG